MTAQESERAFAARVDALATDEPRRHELAALLDESHPVYRERGAAASARMRGWILCALARGGLPTPFVVFALEELDNGREAYLVACAAHALRSHAQPSAQFAPFLAKALANIRFHDDALALDRYGGYAVGSPDTTAVREILTTIAWLGPLARGVAPALEQLRGAGGLSPAEAQALALALKQAASGEPTPDLGSCCPGADLAFLRGLGTLKEWASPERRANARRSAIAFEDQAGRRVDYDSFFSGKPAIVVFFYTRCDNPEKCSLTVTKLGHVVRSLAERGLSARIRSAGISYDPLWDVPERLLGYANSRQLACDDDHRLLRAIAGEAALHAHFELGVNFVASLVNRHRVELFLLDREGRIAASFTRLQWDVDGVIERATALLAEDHEQVPMEHEHMPGDSPEHTRPGPDPSQVAALTLGPALGLVSALLPKCALCWTAYLSVFGIASLPWPSAAGWLAPAFGALLLLQLASVLRRCQIQRSWLPFVLSALGAAAILLGRFALDHALVGWLGMGLSLLGSSSSVFSRAPWTSAKATSARRVRVHA